MSWQGMDDFLGDLDDAKERARVGASRHCYETATLVRDRALENMGRMGIGLVTGRSRALYGVKAPDSLFGSTAGSISAYAGYLSWPLDVSFYPAFLNDGTVNMVSRPYHSEAVETGERFFFNEASRVLDYAITGRWEP